MADAKKPKATPAVSYLVAKTITVAFKDGQVSLVTADGQIRGIHLQPVEVKPKASEKEKPAAGRKVAESATAAGRTRP